MIDDLYEKALFIFQKLIPKDDYLLALDWQHTCYPYYPPRKSELGRAGCVGFIPDGDYSIFLSKTFDFGWFGHPWEPTICVFGQRLIDKVNELKPKLFSNVVRINGRAV